MLPELAYMILRKGNYAILIEFLRSRENGELKLEKSTPEDLARTAEILEKYADSKIDESGLCRLRQWQKG